ncbi:MAG: Precorrin methylase [Acidimicrobiales bacterium]|nr:Precorrin methylase [Acidimicrobiales bacterium]
MSGATERSIAVVGLIGGRPVGAAAEAALRDATLVAGSADQLAATVELRGASAETVVVAGGLGALDVVVAHDGPACVLASGDPGFFGIARAVRARLAAADVGGRRASDGGAPTRPVEVFPAPSSVALAFARAGVSWEGAIVRSAHTGHVERIAAEVAVAPVAAVLCGPDAPPEVVAAALLAHGAHHGLAVVAAHLAEPDEQVTTGDLASIASGSFPHRSVLVLAHPAAADHGDGPPGAAGRPGGRPVGDFSHRAGMITKPEVRSVVLGKLDLPAAGVLWDLGAGSGSVAIEAALAAPGLRVIAVERNADDAARAVANAAALGAVVEVVVGDAVEVLDRLPRPDRAFVGGGGLDVLDAAWEAVAPGGVVVATFAAVDRAAEAYRRLGSLVQVAVGQAGTLPDGGVRFAADNPVFVAWGTKPRSSSGTEEALATGSVVALGIGCSTHATAAEVQAVAAEALSSQDAERALTLIASIDRRRDHPAVAAVAEGAGRPLVTFPASLLATVAVPTPSAAVDDAVGTPSVAEAAALLAAGPRSRLVVTKQRGPTATAAIAVGEGPSTPGRVTVVGLGPGAARHRTPAAVDAVRSADAVVGYGPYVDAVADLVRPSQRLVRSTMGAESDRAEAAVALAAAGWRVALVSSGDAGVFGMASTALDAAAGVVDHGGRPVVVRTVPGVTAAHAGAAAVGAPLAGAHAAITLSDILVPWERIEGQLRAAAGAGLALALYNPRSKGRPDHLARALAVLAGCLGPDTPVAVVTAAGDAGESVVTGTLATIDPGVAGMRSVVLVGTADTVIDPVGRVVTSRHHPTADDALDGTRP